MGLIKAILEGLKKACILLKLIAIVAECFVWCSFGWVAAASSVERQIWFEWNRRWSWVPWLDWQWATTTVEWVPAGSCLRCLCSVPRQDWNSTLCVISGWVIQWAINWWSGNWQRGCRGEKPGLKVSECLDHQLWTSWKLIQVYKIESWYKNNKD